MKQDEQLYTSKQMDYAAYVKKFLPNYVYTTDDTFTPPRKCTKPLLIGSQWRERHRDGEYFGHFIQEATSRRLTTSPETSLSTTRHFHR